MTSTNPVPADEGLRRVRAASFDSGAAVYSRVRPTYPREAVAWITADPAEPGRAPRVIDLAAGTGKLTARLVEAGVDVLAVEPSDAMRAELSATLPQVPAVSGTAEQIPVDDGVVDGVVVAQAWHWFDAEAACREIARVLRPGGRLGVLWNVRDHTVDWVARFTEIIHRGDDLGSSHGPPLLSEDFTDVEHADFPWADRIRTTALRDLAASRSHVLTLPEDEREALLDDVDALARTHPDLARRDEVALPYVTRCWRARRR